MPNTDVYKFYLADSSDLSLIGEFTFATGRTFYHGLNKAGNAHLTVSFDDPLATLIKNIVTCIVIKQNGNIVWSGPVWTKEKSASSRTINVSAVGWFELLNHRLIRTQWADNENLIGNGSFDGSATTDWVVAAGSIAANTSVYYSSPASMLITTSGFGNVSATYTYTPSSAALPYVPGHTYRARFRMRRHASWTTGTAGIVLRARSGTSILADSLTTQDPTTLATTGWQQYEAVLEMPEGTDNIQVFFATVTALDVSVPVVYIDNVELHRQMNFSQWFTSDLAQYLLSYTNDNSPTGITPGSSPETWRRTVKYDPLTKIGPEIQRMSEIENGYDWEIDPETREFNIFYPYRGNFIAKTPSAETSILSIGPTHYYKMDESSGSVMVDTIDTSGNGDYFSSPTLGEPTLAALDPGGSAVKFNGVDEYAGMPSIDIQDKSFAISLLVNVDDLSDHRPLFHLITSQNHFAALWTFINQTGSVDMTFLQTIGQAQTPIGTITTGQTYHIVFTYDVTDLKQRIYVNGVLMAEHTSSGQLAVFNPEVYIASHTRIGSDYFMDGTMDEVAVWVGRTLSPSEVSYLYQSLMQAVEQDYTVLGYKWGPDNISEVTERSDSSRLTNWFVTQGKATDISGGALAYDTASINAYGAFEDSDTLNQVESTQILAAYSNAEVAVLRRPLVTYDVTLRPWTDSSPSHLRPFIDFDIGDVLTLTCKDGALDIENQNIRIFGMEIAVDDNGIASVTNLETGP